MLIEIRYKEKKARSETKYQGALFPAFFDEEQTKYINQAIIEEKIKETIIKSKKPIGLK